VASLFERALAGPIYDANQHAWDEVLDTLNLGHCYQLAVAKVLSEGRWRNSENPRAYVATAAARQALAMRLPDFRDKGIYRLPGEESKFDSGEQATRRQSISPPRYDGDRELMPDIVDGAAEICDTPSVWERIPEWLQHDEDADAVDWCKVAQHAARKRAMVPMLGRALTLRASGISRPRAVAMARDKQEARAIEAAWKWIDREWERLIVPLFHDKSLPERNSKLPTSKSCRTDFLKPWEALARVLARHVPKADQIPAPSLEKPDNLRALTRQAGLRPDVSLEWDGHSLCLRVCGQGASASPKPCLIIQGCTLTEAIEALHDPSIRECVPELFVATGEAKA